MRTVHLLWVVDGRVSYVTEIYESKANAEAQGKKIESTDPNLKTRVQSWYVAPKEA